MSTVDLDAFTARARALVERHAERRTDVATGWGVGSDRIPLLEEADPERERADLDAARRWCAQLAAADLHWVDGPVEYGGAGLGPEYDEALRALLAEYVTPNMAFFGIAQHMLAPAILRHGDDELKRRYLPRLFSGELVACQLFSEPDAGSDLAAVRTTAVRDGDDWIVNGQKVWSSYAHMAEVGELLVRTDPDAPKHRGMTMFVVDMSQPGVEVRPLQQINGSAAFNEVFLTDVRVSDRDRIGALGEGWAVARTTLLSERGAVGAGETTPMSRVVPRLVELAAHQGRADDPEIRARLADVYLHERVMTAVGERHAEGDGPGPLGSVSKLLFSDQLRRVSELASELLGPALVADTGEWGTFSWSEFVLSAPGLRIAGGTDEIMLNIIGEQVLGLPREPRAA